MKKAILINDTSNELHIGCDNVIKNIKYLLAKNSIEIVRTFTRQDINNRRNTHELKNCDIIILNGEGSLHDEWGHNWLTRFLKIIPKGKKAVLINSVWHNMGIIKGLDKFSLISVRETNSYESIMKDNSHLKIWKIPDVIFCPQPPERIKIGYGDSNNNDIATQLWLCHSEYFPLTYNRKGNYGHPKKLDPKNIDSYYQWLKSLDLYVTGRFHGICLSAMVGVPFLAFASNAGKIEGLLKDMMCEELLIKDIIEVDSKKHFALALASKASYYAECAKHDIEGLFREIKRIAYEK